MSILFYTFVLSKDKNRISNLRPPTDGLNGDNMVYRAKITRIVTWVEDNYNFIVHNVVRDAKDVYIELNNPDEAELLELINRKQEELLELKVKWYEEFE